LVWYKMESTKEDSTIATPGRTYGCHACNAWNCKNRQRIKFSDGSYLIHRFPKEPERCLEWVRRAGREDLLNKPLSYLSYNLSLCSDHFHPDCYIEKKTLRSDALPTIFNPGRASDSECAKTENKMQFLKEEMKAFIEFDNPQLNWSSQNTIDMARVVDDTPLESGFLLNSSEADGHVNDGKDAEKSNKQTEVVFDDEQEMYEEIIQDSYISNEELENISKQREEMMCDGGVKTYGRIQSTKSHLSSSYIEDESELPYENCGENFQDDCEENSGESQGISRENHQENSGEICQEKSKKTHLENFRECEEIINSKQELLNVKWEILPEEICRLCASKDEQHKQPIYLWMKIMKKLIPEMVALNDGLPQYICKTCAEKLHLCVTIKKGFIESYKKLRSEINIIGENVKTECDNLAASDSDYDDNSSPLHNPVENFASNNESVLFNSEQNSIHNEDIANIKSKEIAASTHTQAKCKKRKKLVKYSCICMECEKLFLRAKALKDHLKSEHNAVKCQYCHRYFTDTSELQNHTKTHTDTQYKCKCGAQVGSIKDLKDHIINHNPPKHTCSVCHKKFYNFFEMKHHEKGHKKAICEICGKQLKKEAYLQLHMRRHTGEKPYQCEQCGVSFTTSDRYYIHRYKRHSTERIHCEICGTVLFTELAFRRHMRAHEKGTMQHCEVCLVQFRYQFSKDMHRSTRCSTCICVVCSMIFPDSRELIEHRSKEHTEEEITNAAIVFRNGRRYSCSLCSKSYKKPDSLCKHKRKHHGDQKKTSKEFSPKKNKTPKKQRNVFNCTKCEKKFKSQKALTVHTASFHEDENCNFSCSYCKEKFAELNTLISHESQHLKEKVFSCCGWIFCTKADFIRHKRLHSQNVPDIAYGGENYDETTELNIVLPSDMLT
ncbi:hypothetical protein L9F63_017060, partial [Diploptera punctata]